ncbi:hypothetical protein [Micromonospora sp. ATCC 39149]|uniref:hypothetical protein n=1 Tax=Micromonospora sp. (strain ATCC 39149 / NRRL 15099 / SCC 1413) TaxID=219305 RepID=UPI0002E797B0|nr:hypothetical protein [Micromonospora sp. ATCC 39149]
MRMQPRQQLLEIWRATARLCYRDGTWVWGGRDGSNSISDAEQLLCLMLPATTDPRFVLEWPDATSDDVLRALNDFGDAIEVPRLLVRVLNEYLLRYTRPDGTPIFSGAGYFHVDGSDELSAEQAGMDIVDSYTMSVAACPLAGRSVSPGVFRDRRGPGSSFAHEIDGAGRSGRTSG